MTKKFQKALAFMLTVIMAMTINLPSGTSGIFDFVKRVNAATITATQPTNGDGSSSSPYQIGTAGELLWFANQVNGGSTTANAVLTADIDLSGISNWTPIGNSDNQYEGTFDGKSYTIKNMSITEQGNYSGLFGYTSGAEIKNINITGKIALTTTSYTEGYGSIVGRMDNSTVTNCHSSVDITINTTMASSEGNCIGHIGGIVGKMHESNSTISNCSYSGTINLKDKPVNVAAGIVGYAIYSTAPITNCSFTGTINSTYTGATIIGGIFGYTRSSGDVKVTNCLSAGTITKSGDTSVTGMIIGQINTGYGNNAVKNNYYISSSSLNVIGSTSDTPTTNPATACTTDELSSGKICYLLNNGVTDGTQAWYQTIGTDNLPMLEGDIVYYDASANPQYYNIVEAEVPEGDGSAANPYQIANYTQLVWFQEKIDGGEYTANAVLTKDITANKNLLDGKGGVSGTPKYTWTPITQNSNSYNNRYRGIFDGQKHTISGLYAPYNGYKWNYGLFGRADGTIKNVFITDSYFGGSDCIYSSSFAGSGFNSCVIENCGSDAVVVGSMYCGGIAGDNTGKVNNCYFAGKMNADTTYSNAIIGEYTNRGTLTNCYYLYGCGATSNHAASMTEAQFESGEVCYGLNNGVVDGTQTWYQTLGTDKYPSFSGGIVYKGYNEETEKMVYANSPLADCPHSNCTNGFCNICDEPETPKLIDGNYQIANYGNLVWFQQYVDSGNLSTNAVLTEDITANNKLLDENGNVLGTPKYKWTPIAQKASNYTLHYNGVFDGQGHTISGLYAPYYTTNYCALFGHARGTVKNIFITDSYFGGSGCYYACSFVGNGGCNIENCGSDAVVAGTKYCGGIAGINYGKITSCYFAGKISATTSSNAIASDYDYNYDLIRCYYLDDCGLTSTRATSMEKVKFASGEVCYLLNNGVTDGTQAWYQTIGTDTLPKFKGRIVGYNESVNPQYFNLCDDEHQWSEKPTSTIDPTCTEDGYDIYTCTVCGYTKNVANNTPASHKWSEKPTSTVDPTCTEDGYDVYTCTVCGATKNVANNTPASHKWSDKITIVNPTCTEDGYEVYTCAVCGETKNVANNTPATHRWAIESTVDPTCTEDGYDVYTCTVCGKTKNVANNTPASHKWGTPTTVDPTCTEDGYDVYTCTVCGKTKNEVNDGTALGHNPNDDGICTECHKYVAKQPANGDGSLENPYQIENYGHLMWFQEYVDSGHYSVNAVLTKDIIINEDVYFDENFELSREPEYVWTPISMNADASTCYSGVFDGQGHTIRGLFAPYYDDCCGLFGRANGTIKNVFITFSYFGSTYNAATFVGYGYDNCVIENCGSEAFVGDASYCGGIAGQTSGEITNCYFAGMFLFDPDISDAIVNDNNGNSTITNCYYLDTCGATSEGAKSKTADQFASGEVCYLLNGGVTDSKQTWYQTLTTDTLPKFKGKTVYYSESADPQYYNEAVIGDVSCNDTTDKADAALVLKYISGIGTFSDYQLTVADANSDGKVDMLDVIKILGLVG